MDILLSFYGSLWEKTYGLNSNDFPRATSAALRRSFHTERFMAPPILRGRRMRMFSFCFHPKCLSRAFFPERSYSKTMSPSDALIFSIAAASFFLSFRMIMWLKHPATTDGSTVLILVSLASQANPYLPSLYSILRSFSISSKRRCPSLFMGCFDTFTRANSPGREPARAPLAIPRSRLMVSTMIRITLHHLL